MVLRHSIFDKFLHSCLQIYNNYICLDLHQTQAPTREELYSKVNKPFPKKLEINPDLSKVAMRRMMIEDTTRAVVGKQNYTIFCRCYYPYFKCPLELIHFKQNTI